MASEETLDIEALLAPISAESHTGQDLRADISAVSPYRKLRDVRSAAREFERGSVLEDDPGAATSYWRPVLDTAPEILGTLSKDLEVAAWLIEAEVRLNGFAGLRDGLRLTRELVERYWEELYPSPDEDGLATRVAPLAGLNGEGGEGTLIAPMRRVALTEAVAGGPFALWHYQQAAEVSQIADAERRKRRLGSGAVALETVEKAAAATTPQFFAALSADLTACLDEFDRLTAKLDALCGPEHAPPSSNIRNTLIACQEALTFMHPPKAETSEHGDEQTTGLGNVESTERNSDPPVLQGQTSPSSFSSREDAFRILLSIAGFFRRTEPHSPIPYLLEQAVRWGRMPLPDLLKELVDDDKARAEVCRLAGIQENQP
jgi:type VI secretion system protein ImpA